MADNLFSLSGATSRATAQQSRRSFERTRTHGQRQGGIGIASTLARLLKQRGEGWVGDIGAFFRATVSPIFRKRKRQSMELLNAREQAEVDMDWKCRT